MHVCYLGQEPTETPVPDLHKTELQDFKPRNPNDMSPMELQALAREYDRLGNVKINSSTHKIQWNVLYRMTQANSKGEPKCDRDIYDRWHQGCSMVVQVIFFAS